MNRKPTLDELIGADTTGAERQRLQHVHELLLEAGPPPELSPELEQGPNLNMTMGKRAAGRVKQRAMVLLAAAIVVFFVFIGGYVANNPAGRAPRRAPSSPRRSTARSWRRTPKATLEVWSASAATGP